MSTSRKSFLTGGAAAGMAIALPRLPAVSAQNRRLEFAYRSDFWLNLHHRLYNEAQVVEFVRAGHVASRPASLAMLADQGRLSPAQRRIWDEAIGSYIDGGFTKKDLLFDDSMTEIKEAIAGRARGATLDSDALPAALKSALMSSAPVYEHATWTADDEINKGWIASVQPLVAAYGDFLTTRLRAVYQWDWPIGPYRVDVVRYGSQFSAYTTAGPIHIVVESSANTGTSALEILFHEASHAVVVPDAGTIGTAIENAATIVGKTEPPNFWHALMFYTVGSLTTEAVLRGRNERYTMYADQWKLWDRGWQSYREPLKTMWQPYIDGKTEMQAAILSMMQSILV